MRASCSRNREGELAGVHLEGPYLSTARCGAQNPAHLRYPDQAELSDLVGLGVVKVVTVAPELPGGPAAIEHLRAHGVVAAVGARYPVGGSVR